MLISAKYLRQFKHIGLSFPLLQKLLSKNQPPLNYKIKPLKHGFIPYGQTVYIKIQTILNNDKKWFQKYTSSRIKIKFNQLERFGKKQTWY